MDIKTTSEGQPRRVGRQLRLYQQAAREMATSYELLEEALDHITPKYWDDPTHLHYRISTFLGIKPKYVPPVDEFDE